MHPPPTCCLHDSAVHLGTVQLDPCCLEAGAWTTTITSAYLAQLHQLYSAYRVRIAALPASVAPAWACHSSGANGSSKHLAAHLIAGGSSSSSSMQLTPQGVLLRHEQRRGAWTAWWAYLLPQ
jgi:hypothetical protein